MKTNSTLFELKTMLDKGEISSREIVEHYIEKIEEKDKEINAFLFINREEALKMADICDEERKNGKAKGLLHGLPIAIKDNMSAQGMQNTCGSKFLEGYISPYDATVVRKIREEGGIILGKLNMDEFAMGSANEYSAFGPVRNPWDKERIPGGSSGGSAAAVSGLMAPVSLGTDTGGSVRQPAAFNNLVGLKPTYGRISRYGVTAFGSTLDQVGILSRDVLDNALMLEVLSGKDDRDNTSLDAEVPKYSSILKGDVKGLKIAVPESFLKGLKSQIRENFESVLEIYRKLGAEISYINLEIVDKALAVYYIVASAEASSNLARFDGIRYGKRAVDYDDTYDLYAKSRSEGFGKEVKRRIMLGTYVLSAGYYDAFYTKALKVRTRIIEEFKKVFKEYDVIMTPSTPVMPKKIGEVSKNVVEDYLNDLYTVPANIAGIPAISVPGGFIEGLPLGFQILGNYFEEETILNAALAFEKVKDYKNMTPKEEQ